jgi:hypothetical protein
LQRIFRILGVAKDAQRGLKERALIPAEERFHGLRVASLPGANQLLFAYLRSSS